MTRGLTRMAFTACALLTLGAASQAKTPKHAAPSHAASSGGKMVAYDAKDRRYYSVAWAKAHGMRDKGGDPLTILPLASLPKDAKESKAMKGAKI